MKDPLIKIHRLTKSVNLENKTNQFHTILHDINLEIYEGDIFGIVGMSGAGKSTLLRCMASLDFPSSGALLFEGEKIEKNAKDSLQRYRENIGMIFQHFHLFSSRTVFENISYPLEIKGIPKDIQEERVRHLLNLVSLADKESSYPSRLSGGEKQRVGIARALAHHPKILFCDEPTSALDPQTSKTFLELLLHLNKTLGLTIVFISHQIEAVKFICNRVAVLSQGKIMEEGSPQSILTNPLHSIKKELLQFI